MHHPIDRMIHTTAFVTPVVKHWLEREIAQWVYDKEGTNFKYAFINVPHHYQQHIHYLVLVLVTCICKNLQCLKFRSFRDNQFLEIVK